MDLTTTVRSSACSSLPLPDTQFRCPVLLVWSCPSCWCGPGILPVLMWTLVTGPVHQSCWSHPSSYPAGVVLSQLLVWSWYPPSPDVDSGDWSRPPVLLVTSQFLSCWNGPSPAGHIPVPILLEWSQSCWSHPSSYPAGMVPVLLVTSQFLSCFPFLMRSHSLVIVWCHSILVITCWSPIQLLGWLGAAYNFCSVLLHQNMYFTSMELQNNVLYTHLRSHGG